MSGFLLSSRWVGFSLNLAEPPTTLPLGATANIEQEGCPVNTGCLGAKPISALASFVTLTKALPPLLVTVFSEDGLSTAAHQVAVRP